MTQKTLKEPHMKILAINRSPNKDKGNTAMILLSFFEGMREAGSAPAKSFNSSTPGYSTNRGYPEITDGNI